VRLGEKIAVTVSNNLAMPAWSILVSKSSLDHAQMMLTTRQAFYASMRLNRSVFQHPLSRVAERRAIRSGLGAQFETHDSDYINCLSYCIKRSSYSLAPGLATRMMLDDAGHVPSPQVAVRQNLQLMRLASRDRIS